MRRRSEEARSRQLFPFLLRLFGLDRYQLFVLAVFVVLREDVDIFGQGEHPSLSRAYTITRTIVHKN